MVSFVFPKKFGRQSTLQGYDLRYVLTVFYASELSADNYNSWVASLELLKPSLASNAIERLGRKLVDAVTIANHVFSGIKSVYYVNRFVFNSCSASITLVLFYFNNKKSEG